MSSNQSRDQAGRWTSSQAGDAGGAAAAVHTPAAARTPVSISSGNSDPHVQPAPAAASITDLPTATRPGTGGMSPAASISHNDDWGNLGSATSALVNRPVGGKGGGMTGVPVGPVKPRDVSAGYRRLGLGSNEVGSQVKTQEGSGQHGCDIAPGGVPGPAGDTPAGGVPGGADAAGDIAADLLPLAEAAI